MSMMELQKTHLDFKGSVLPFISQPASHRKSWKFPKT
jgi:hypothetical protein